MQNQNKNIKIFIYIISVFILIWSGLNFGSYFIFKTYLEKNNHIIKEKIVNILNLDKNQEYVFNLNSQVHWGFIFLNLYVENIEFYDKKEENIKIHIKKLNMSFLLNKIFTKKIIPYSIESNKANIFLKNDLFKKIFSEDIEKKNIEPISNDSLKRILKIKNLNFKKLNFHIFEENFNEETEPHTFENLEIHKINKRKFELKTKYSDKKYVEKLELKSNILFDFNQNIIKINKLQNSIILKNFERFPGLKKINISNLSDIEIFLNENLKLKKIKFNAIKSNIKIFDDKQKNIAKIDLINHQNHKNLFWGIYDHNQKKIEISEFDFALNEKTKFKTDFLLDFLNPKEKKIKLNINLLSKLWHDDLQIFWPLRFFADTKKWYEKSILDGKFNNIKLLLDLKFDPKWNFLEEKSHINGEIDFNELKMDCCGGSFPVLENLGGSVHFDMNKLHAKVNKGFIEVEGSDNLKKKICLNLATVDFDFTQMFLNVNGIVKNSLKTLIDLYDKNFKINILGEDILENISGNGVADFEISVDLSSKKNSNDPQILKNINIKTTDFSTFLVNQGKHLFLKTGNFKMNISNFKNPEFHDINFEGFGDLNQKEFKIITNRQSKDQNKIISNISFKVDYSEVDHLLDPILSSIIKIKDSMFVNVEVINHINSNDDEFNLDIDLKDTIFSADYAKINKKKGDNAFLKFNLKKTPENDFFIKDLKLSQGKNNLFISKIDYIDSKKETDVFSIKYNSSLIDSINFKSADNKNSMQIYAKDINYFDFDWFGFEGDDKNKSNSITGFIENLSFLENLKIRNLKLNIECDSESCHTMSLENNKKQEKGEYLNAKLQNNIIDVLSDNAGLILRGMNLVKYIYDGELNLHSYLNQYKDKKFIIQNDLTIKNFYLRKAPAVAHILSLATVTGAFSDLRGKGIHFGKLKSNFVFHDNKIKFGKSIANGFSVGFSFDGNVDLNNDAFEIDGSVMPFNFLNIVLRNIPLIGEVLVGKPGEGFFSIDFEASGNFQNPQYKINPFRMFVPYFIKKFFLKNKGEKSSNSLKIP